jgi:hypothetical protein
MVTPEKRFESQIVAKLEARGWFAHHFDANGVDGWPDILAVSNDRFLLIEVKAGTKIRKAQKAFHALLEQTYGVNVHVLEQHADTVALDGDSYASLHEALEMIA